MGLDRTVDARWAEQQLLSHDARRRTLGYEQQVAPPSTIWDRDTDAPPPSLVHQDDAESLNQGYGAVGSPDQRAESGTYSASPNRWASRFRDGSPPPPAPPPPITDRDVFSVMQQLGINPQNNPRAKDELDRAIEQGRLGLDPATRMNYDLYGYVRAQQRVSEKRRRKRGQLDPTLAAGASFQSLPHLNDRSGGGPMQPQPSAISSGAPEHAPPFGVPGVPPSASNRNQPVRGQYPAPPVSADFRTDQDSPLTRSQKRRLRRKRQRQGPGLIPDTDPRPTNPAFYEHALRSVDTDLWADPVLPTEYRNGTTPLPSDPYNPDAYPASGISCCGATVSVQFAVAEPPTNLVCPLNPFPHREQPHLIEVPRDLTGGVEVFIGWFDQDAPS